MASCQWSQTWLVTAMEAYYGSTVVAQMEQCDVMTRGYAGTEVEGVAVDYHQLVFAVRSTVVAD